MAKSFKIAQNTTFKQMVKVPRVGGDPIEVEFEFKYLTRPQLSHLQDTWDVSTKDMIEKWSTAREKEELAIEDMTEDETKHNIKQLQDIVVGWSFDDEFNEDNIRALVESSIGSVEAVVAAYHQAYQKTKLGN